MIDGIIEDMRSLFKKGIFTKKTSFRFHVDEVAITVVLDADTCEISKEDTGKVDCTCKTSAEMFRKIWYDGYRPGMMDFLGGAVKSDAPFLLPQFLKAFGKEL